MKRGRKPTAHGPETPPIVGEGRGWERVRLYEHRKTEGEQRQRRGESEGARAKQRAKAKRETKQKDKIRRTRPERVPTTQLLPSPPPIESKLHLKC